MPAKGDARPERQSSGLGASLRLGLGRSRNYARIAFAAFVLSHSLLEAYRAASAGALPEPGLETEPVLVALVLVCVWLPFLADAGYELSAPRGAAALAKPLPQQRALQKIEPAALLVVLAFALFHGLALVWPLLTGQLLPADVRPELIALLSSTRSGVPLQAIAALCAVGAASFYASRQASKAYPNASPALARALVMLGIASYLLGSYAVIRCATGSLLP